ncbi:MAG: bile acid:sodium symporter family protein [Erythrobacter sp.]
MRMRLSILADPMIAVLLAATLLALAAPAAGELRATAQAISNIGVFVLFLVNGMRVSHGEMAQGIRNWRYFGPLALWVFGVMAAAGMGFSALAGAVLPPLVALGFLYLGILPSTIQSATSYTTLAHGNVALAVVGAALINILGVFVSAPLFALLAGGRVVDVGLDAIGRIMLILVLPFVIGQLLQRWAGGWVRARRAQIVWLDRVVIGIAVYVAMSGAVEQGLMHMFGPATWVWLAGLTVAFLVTAHLAAWWAGQALGYAMADRKAFLFAGAQKSVATGAPLAAVLFAPDVGGFLIAPLLLYHLLQLVMAAPLASWLARR